MEVGLSALRPQYAAFMRPNTNRPRHSHPQNHAIRSSPGCVGMVGGGGWSLHMELIAVGVGVCGWNAVFVIICNQCLKLPFLKMQNEPLLSLFFRRSVQ